MLVYMCVGLGGGLGAMTRFWLNGVISRWSGETFPLGTLTINVTGSMIIGLFAALTDPDGRWMVDPMIRTFFMVGMCGGYTTFSSFSLQTLNLARDGEWLYAGANVLLSLSLCLLSVWVGHVAGVSLSQPGGR